MDHTRLASCICIRIADEKLQMQMQVQGHRLCLTPLIYHIHQDTRFQPGHLRVLNIIVPIPCLSTYLLSHLPTPHNSRHLS